MPGGKEVFKNGEPVFARVPGYPWWPARCSKRHEIVLDDGEEEPVMGPGDMLVSFFNDDNRFAVLSYLDLRPFSVKANENLNGGYKGEYLQELNDAFGEALRYAVDKKWIEDGGSERQPAAAEGVPKKRCTEGHSNGAGRDTIRGELTEASDTCAVTHNNESPIRMATAVARSADSKVDCRGPAPGARPKRTRRSPAAKGANTAKAVPSGAVKHEKRVPRKRRKLDASSANGFSGGEDMKENGAAAQKTLGEASKVTGGSGAKREGNDIGVTDKVSIPDSTKTLDMKKKVAYESLTREQLIKLVEARDVEIRCYFDRMLHVRFQGAQSGRADDDSSMQKDEERSEKG